MTDPDDKPSFLARLAVVATIGVLAFQLFAGIVMLWEKMRRGKVPNEAILFVGIFPVLAHFAVAGIYYIFKGKPTNADIVVTFWIYRAWAISLIGGLAFYIFI